MTNASEALIRAAIQDEAVRRSLWTAIRAMGVQAPDPTEVHDPTTGRPSWWPVPLAGLAFFVAEEVVRRESENRAKILELQGTVRALRRQLKRASR